MSCLEWTEGQLISEVAEIYKIELNDPRRLGKPGADLIPPSRRLARTQNYKVKPYGVRAAGFLANHPESLKNLPDGWYIYQVDDLANVIVSSRFPHEVDPSKDGAKYVALHESLNQTLKDKTGEDSHVLASGQFRIKNGRVLHLDNKSGRWHGRADHLIYGEQMLKTRGLETESITERTDVSVIKNKNFDDHTPEAEQGRLHLGRHPWVEELEQFEAEIEPYFPADKKNPGYPNLQKLIKFFGKYANDEEYNSSNQLAGVMVQSQKESPESVIGTIEAKNRLKPKEAVDLSLRIQEFRKFFYSHLRAAQDAGDLPWPSKPAPRPPKPLLKYARDRQAFEIPSAGFVAKDDKALSKLPDGWYVYLVDHKNNLAVSSRTPKEINPDVPGAQYLATHEALEQMLHEQGGGAAVVAAGQFRIYNGRVMVVDSKSGRWRGDHERLKVGEQALVAHGLPVEEKTLRRNWKKIDNAERARVRDPDNYAPNHDPEGLQARLELRYPEVAKKIEDFGWELAHYFPNEDVPGTANVSELIKLVKRMQEYPGKKGLSAEEGARLIRRLGEFAQYFDYAKNEATGVALAAAEKVGKIRELEAEVDEFRRILKRARAIGFLPVVPRRKATRIPQ